MSALPDIGAFVRRHDPDRFLTSLFAPPERRPALWALFAFNHELARARETVREPMMALIRLQWWREVVEGAARRHEVATPLRAALSAGLLAEADLLALIEAREAEAPESEAGWADWVSATAGRLALAAGRALSDAPVSGLMAAGAAYGAAGLLRNRALNRQAPVPGLAEQGRRWLAEARAARIPRRQIAAALPAVLAARDLGRAAPVRERGLGDRLAVTVAALTGRI